MSFRVLSKTYNLFVQQGSHSVNGVPCDALADVDERRVTATYAGDLQRFGEAVAEGVSAAWGREVRRCFVPLLDLPRSREEEAESVQLLLPLES